MNNGKLIISKLLLNPKSMRVHNDLLDLNSLHHSLKSAFQIYGGREKVSLLFRIYTATNLFVDRTPILVQSLVVPIWDVLSDLKDYFVEKPIIEEINSIKIYNDSTYQFLLHASPSHLSREHKVVRLYRDQLFSWIINEGYKNGFFVEESEIRIKQLPSMIAIKVKKGEKSRIIINPVEYSGLLHVYNNEKLTHALLNGIGRGLEFGCGLISVASQ